MLTKSEWEKNWRQRKSEPTFGDDFLEREEVFNRRTKSEWELNWPQKKAETTILDNALEAGATFAGAVIGSAFFGPVGGLIGAKIGNYLGEDGGPARIEQRESQPPFEPTIINNNYYYGCHCTPGKKAPFSEGAKAAGTVAGASLGQAVAGTPGAIIGGGVAGSIGELIFKEDQHTLKIKKRKRHRPTDEADQMALLP